MINGLEALNEIVNEACRYTAFLSDIQIIERANIIEKELKEHKEIKTYMQQYEIENVEELRRVLHNDWVIRQKFKTDTANIPRALEIIKNERVDVDLLLSSLSLKYYNEQIYEEKLGEKQLTQKEYNLLNEVLL